MINIKFINDVNPALKEYINHYWIVTGHNTEPITNKILPMDHVDLIINLGQPFLYRLEDNFIKPDDIHFHGIKDSITTVIHRGNMHALGVSFSPWGFYFLCNKRMDNFTNSVTNLSDINTNINSVLSNSIEDQSSIDDIINILELKMISNLAIRDKEARDCNIIKNYITSNNTIRKYCNETGISTRRLERIFRKYVGVTPHQYKNIVRFECTSRDVMYDKEKSLIDIAYDNGYSDQAHFTNVFKSYTNTAPTVFKKNGDAAKLQFNLE